MDFFSQEQKKKIVSAIKEAEKMTSGEIKVHIEPECLGGDAIKRAQVVFTYLSLQKTALRNGVLFYLAYDDKKFAVMGDKGIHHKVGQSFWDSTKALLAENFGKGEFVDGLIAGINEAGKQLQQHFPYQRNDVNEISDDISQA